MSLAEDVLDRAAALRNRGERFVVATVVVLAALPFVVPGLFARISGRASEPEIKFLFLVLFAFVLAPAEFTAAAIMHRR